MDLEVFSFLVLEICCRAILAGKSTIYLIFYTGGGYLHRYGIVLRTLRIAQRQRKTSVVALIVQSCESPAQINLLAWVCLSPLSSCEKECRLSNKIGGGSRG